MYPPSHTRNLLRVREKKGVTETRGQTEPPLPVGRGSPVIPSCSPLFWEGNLFGVPSPITLNQTYNTPRATTLRSLAVGG
jgi:hypothetical protein